MKIRLTATYPPTRAVLATGVYEFAKEGDLEEPVGEIMRQARAALGGGPAWEVLISASAAE